MLKAEQRPEAARGTAGPTAGARILRAALAFLPWIASLYLLYWLEYGELWETDMNFRSVFAVLILAVGMATSFLLHSWLARNKSR